jgi:hypothetical protein
MILLELFLWGVGLVLLSAGWDAGAAAWQARRGGAARGRLAFALLLLFPALCCWTLVFTSATIRLTERPVGPRPEVRLT